MKKWIIPSICTICIIFLIVTTFTSHKGTTYTSIGSTYNSFLFIPAKSAHFPITFKSSWTGMLTLTDENRTPLPSNKYTIRVDGRATGPSFRVHNKRIVNVAIKCSKTLDPGKKYIQVKGGGPFVTHVYFTHHLNPLAVWFSWILSLCAICLLVWFIILRRLFYPQFKSCQKTFYIPDQNPLIVRLTGARMVVISSEQKKQSIWDALFKGPIIYKVHPAFTSSIAMRPMRGQRILVKADSNKYRISPNPMPLIGSATIDNIKMKLKISIN